MNCLAEEVMLDQEELCFTPKRLSATRLDSAARISTLIESTAATLIGKDIGSGRVVGGAIMIPRRPKLPPLWVVVAPLSRRLRMVIGQEHTEGFKDLRRLSMKSLAMLATAVAFPFTVSTAMADDAAPASLHALSGLSSGEQVSLKAMTDD